MIVVFGDTNSALVAAIAGSKLNIPICHIEAWLRSFDQKIPEEINRIAVDKRFSILSCQTQKAVKNLKNAGITSDRSFHGDTTLDAQ